MQLSPLVSNLVLIVLTLVSLNMMMLYVAIVRRSSLWVLSAMGTLFALGFLLPLDGFTSIWMFGCSVLNFLFALIALPFSVRRRAHRQTVVA